MNILWVIAGGIWPLNTGGRQRSFNIIAQLSKSNRLTLVTSHGPGDDPIGLKANLPDCDVISVPADIPKAGTVGFATALLRSWFSSYPVDVLKNRVPELAQEVSRLLSTRDIDICVTDFLSTTVNVPLRGAVPNVLFEHNVEYVIWKRLKEVDKSWRRVVLEVEWRKMRRHEARACENSALTLTVSDVDREVILKDAPRAKVHSIPTGVDIDYFKPNGSHEIPNRLVFAGAMDWYPNEDGMLDFVHSTLPLIRREMPDVSLTVVGRNPTARIREATAQANVTVTGTVEDIRPFVAESSVFVVPLRVGGGTRMKIFEALAMGKPVVSTTIGAEGLVLNHGEHFLRADTSEEFAQSVVALLRDPAKRKTLAETGRRLVEEHYSWAHVARVFEARCREVISKNAN
jgi:glycosyltransferase involved in cell wall biosynthesis